MQRVDLVEIVTFVPRINNSRISTVKKNPSFGFTLIELMVVIGIIAVLSAAGLVVFSGVQKNARDTKRKEDVQAIAKAYEFRYNPDSQSYPTLTPDAFTNIAPTPQRVGDYTTTFSTNGSGNYTGFRVCAKLDSGSSSLDCQASPSDQNCYCVESVQGVAPTTAPAPTAAPTPAPPASTPTPTNTPTPTPTLVPVCATVPSLSTTSPLNCKTTNPGLNNSSVYVTCPPSSDTTASFLNNCAVVNWCGTWGFSYYTQQTGGTLSSVTFAHNACVGNYYPVKIYRHLP